MFPNEKEMQNINILLPDVVWDILRKIKNVGFL